MNSILVLTNKNHFLFVLGSTCKCLVMFNVSPWEFQGNHGANVSRIFCKYEYERNTNRIAFFLVFFAIVFNSNVFSQPCSKPFSIRLWQGLSRATCCDFLSIFTSLRAIPLALDAKIYSYCIFYIFSDSSQQEFPSGEVWRTTCCDFPSSKSPFSKF